MNLNKSNQTKKTSTSNYSPTRMAAGSHLIRASSGKGFRRRVASAKNDRRANRRGYPTDSPRTQKEAATVTDRFVRAPGGRGGRGRECARIWLLRVAHAVSEQLVVALSSGHDRLRCGRRYRCRRLAAHDG